MLLDLSFRLLAAAVEAMPPDVAKSIVTFSLSAVFEGEKPVVDLRVRRVAGSVVSCGGAMMVRCQGLGVRGCEARVKME